MYFIEKYNLVLDHDTFRLGLDYWSITQQVPSLESTTTREYGADASEDGPLEPCDEVLSFAGSRS